MPRGFIDGDYYWVYAPTVDKRDPIMLAMFSAARTQITGVPSFYNFDRDYDSLEIGAILPNKVLKHIIPPKVK
jgi:hypothetical protein